MLRCDDQHEAVGAERQGFETGHLYRAGDDADIRSAVGDRGDDLVAEPLLQVDIDLRMRGEKVAERLGQEFRQRVGIGHQADLALDALGILRQIAMHSLGLLQQQPGVMDERAAAGVGCTP